MDLIARIKEKRELAGIPDTLVKEVFEKVLKKYPGKLSGKDEKLIVKEARSLLRKYVGRFKPSKKESIISLLKKGKSQEALMLHSSTKERILSYSMIRKIIRDLKPKKILDIGCGINPIALASQDYYYYASDIDEDNLEIVKTFFDKEKFPGETFSADIRKERNFPEADLCLIFKVFDIVKMPHWEIKGLLSSLKCKSFLISFPTITLSGKQMRNKRRVWFEKILQDLDYEFKTIRSDNELFYLIQ